MLGISLSEYLVLRPFRKAEIGNLEYTSGNASPSPAGSVAHAKWVGWPTNPSLIQSRLVVGEAPNQGQDGRPFRGVPRAPILAPNDSW